MRHPEVVWLLLSIFSFVAQHSSPANFASANLPPAAIPAMQKIDPGRIRANVRFLSHDLLEGRGTGQRGGDIAAQYIATQFALEGLKPAGENGTFMQRVPLVGVTPLPQTKFSFVSGGETKDLRPPVEYFADNEAQQAATQSETPHCFFWQ